MTVFAGIDAGGSRTRGVVVDGSGTEVARAESGPSGFQEEGPEAAAATIRALVSDLAEASGGRPARLVCAMAGAGHRESADELRRRLSDAGVADSVAVVNDTEAALHAAFGSGPGIVVIAGTGSIAVGRAADGRTARAGGLRPPGGDPGSGEWIGREAIRSGLVVEPETDRAAVARVARRIGEAARAGDADARALLRRAAGALAALALDVQAQLAPWDDAPRIALAGGLLEPGRPLRLAVSAAIERAAAGLEVLPDSVDAALGSARLALSGGFDSCQKP